MEYWSMSRGAYPHPTVDEARDWTPETFAAAIREIAALGDTEVAHELADGLLCLLLERKGYGEGVKVYKAMARWYA